MSYALNKLLASSQKNFAATIESAEIVTSWALVSGNIYKTNFTLSDTLTEYVTKVTQDGAALTLHTSASVSSGQYFYDWDTKEVYINVGGDPASYTLVVFFNFFCATRSFNFYRLWNVDTSEVVYYAPRILDATIPQISTEDYIRFGTNSGSMRLNNSDGALYVYRNFRNKNIKIWHLIDGEENFKLLYSGKIDNFKIDDQNLTLTYRNNDYIFNKEFNSYFFTGTDSTKGFFSSGDFANIDPNFEGYCVRAVYGVTDDLIPVNIDYSDTPTTSNNRSFVVRAEGTETHSLSYTVQAGSTTTRVNLPSGHFMQVGDAVKVDVGAGNKYTFVTARASTYIDVSPAIGAPSGGEAVTRSTIGYIKIKDQDGNIYNLAFDRDFTEQTFTNNTLGFTLTNNFEANHSPITLFDPAAMQIYCRCYGKKHSSVNDTQYGNMMHAGYILTDLMSNAGLTSAEVAESDIQALTMPALGFAIPEDAATVYPTYREIITQVNSSTLGNIYIDANTHINYFLIAPLGSSSSTLTDKNIFNISFSYDAIELYNLIKLFYYRKENSNGSGLASHKLELASSDMATYLHEVESSYQVYTLLVKQSEASTLATRYRIIYEDWKEEINITAKTEFFENIINNVIDINRTRLVGYNKTANLNTRPVRVTSIKKDLTMVELSLTSQKNIEDKTAEW